MTPIQPASAAEPDPAPETARLTGVDFGYADSPGVLRDVSVTLERASFHFLTGASGAGKSTLLRLLTLSARPSAGSVALFGQDVTHLGRAGFPAFRRRMGVVFQDFRLLDHLSVFDNCALPLRLAGERIDERTEDVEEMLRWVGLGDRMDSRPPALSGGEKQRLAIARAVIHQPGLIVADEPTGSVDKAMGEKLLRLFQSLNRLGATVLVASHDEALAVRSGATVLHLQGGRLMRGPR